LIDLLKIKFLLNLIKLITEMNIEYKLTQTICNNLYKFALLMGRLEMIDGESIWINDLRNLNQRRGNLSAVSWDRNVLDYENQDDVDASMLRKDFINYSKAKLEIKNHSEDLNLDFLKKTLDLIIDDENVAFRKSKRILHKGLSLNSVSKEIALEVKTQPAQIKPKMEKFFEWLKLAFREENPLVMAGVSHFLLAEIHPFEDGNGRVSRIFEYACLKKKGLKNYDLISLESFYLLNAERYYGLLEECIRTRNLTRWIEFFTEGALDALIFSLKKLKTISGGTLDLINCKIVETTEMEKKIVSLMVNLQQPTPSEIAKELDMTRQNVNYFLKLLHEKGVMIKIGKNTGARYFLNLG